MANLVLLLLVAVVIGLVVSSVQRRRRTLVGKRGTSIGADLGALSDQPRVRVGEVTRVGPDSVRLVLRAEAATSAESSDQVLVVALPQWEAGYELLQEWQRTGTSLAVVVPPGSRLVRLRSIGDLQPLTLRRLDAG